MRWVNRMAAADDHGRRQLSHATACVEFDLLQGLRVAATLVTEDLVLALRRQVLERAGLAELVQCYRGRSRPASL